jgi:outer membrane protein TolC
MGLTPGQSYSLAGVETMSPAKSSMTIEEMEQSALLQNADLRESFYNVRIAADDTRKALLKLLPGISFEYSYNFDDDKYLVNDQWNAAGARVSYNLFNILSGPSRMEAAEKNEQLQAARRMALQMSVLTQVHLANHDYLDSKHQFKRAESIYQVDKELADVISKQQRADLVSDLDRISANVTYILSTVRLYQAVAKVQEAESRVQATLGFEPVFDSLDDLDLQAISQVVRLSLDRWSEAK